MDTSDKIPTLRVSVDASEPVAEYVLLDGMEAADNNTDSESACCYGTDSNSLVVEDILTNQKL